MAGYDGLQGGFAMELQNLVAGAQEAGFRVGITSGYRSPELQQKLFDAAVAKYGSPEAAKHWVAPPGKSHHNKGIAADLSFGNAAAREWVHANAARYGLYFPMSWEPWHIEPSGSAGLAQRDAYTTPPPGQANPVDNQPDPHDIGTQFQNMMASLAGVQGTDLLQSPTAAPAPTPSDAVTGQPEDILGTAVEGAQQRERV